LRDEAEGLLAEYRRKRQAAEVEADAIIANARAEAAVAAAEKILSQSAKGEVADRLLADGIRDVKAKLN
jgi:F-type H+-transporting ATPase subunit b